MESRQVLTRGVGLVSAALLVMFATQVSAQEEGQGRRGQGGRGIWGDWQVAVQIGEVEMSSILSFSRGEDRSWKGEWISAFGISEIQDVKFEENKLSFTPIFRMGGNETRAQFAGTIAEGKLTGTVSSDQGEAPVVGKRAPRQPWAVGSWAMVTKMEEREYKGTLEIAAGEAGELRGEYKAERGEYEVTDLKLERRALSFKLAIKMEDSEFEVAFAGELGREGLTGAFKSDEGEAQSTGTRLGAEVIGRWDLEVATDNGTTKQRLTVNRDLSGLWGSLPVKKIELDGDKVSFKAVVKWGEREFPVSFAGTIQEDAITGELTSAQGTSKVTGKKRPARPRGGRGQRGQRPARPTRI